MEKIDLHIHSLYSDDADYSVEHLFDMAKSEGVKIVSVTDHNSVHSVEEAITCGRDKNINVISGVEIDCSFEGNNYHLLGYGFRNSSNDFHVVEEKFNAIQHSLTPLKIEKLKALGFFLDEYHLYNFAGEKVPQEEQMAELILEDRRNDKHPLLLPYRDENSRADMPLINFFWDFFGKNKPCHIDIQYPPMAEVVDLIVGNGGVPVIAHIGANITDNHLLTINKMVSIGVEGVEVFSSYHDETLRQKLYAYTLEKSLLATCGSDFHGKNKPKISLGSCQPWENARLGVMRILERVMVY